MTLDEMIARLAELRATAGGDALVAVDDGADLTAAGVVDYDPAAGVVRIDLTA